MVLVTPAIAQAAHTTVLPANVAGSPSYTSYQRGSSPSRHVDIAGGLIYGRHGERWAKGPLISSSTRRIHTSTAVLAAMAATLPARIHVATLASQRPGVYRYALSANAKGSPTGPSAISLEIEKLADGSFRWRVPGIDNSWQSNVGFYPTRGAGTTVSAAVRLSDGSQLAFNLDRAGGFNVVHDKGPGQPQDGWSGDPHDGSRDP